MVALPARGHALTTEATTGFIYALVGPNGIRYIGRTNRDPHRRYLEHKQWADGARDGRARGWKIAWNYVNVHNWWASLDEDPELVILEEPPLEMIESREQEVIAAYRADGHDLTNRQALMVAILGTDPQAPPASPESDRIILAEIRSGKPFSEARPPMPGFDD